MTALDFIGAGVRFEYRGGVLIVVGPAGRENLLEQLRAEVARRVGRMSGDRLPIIAGTPRDGQCETCADPLPNGRGGMCALCSLARTKALVALGRIPATTAQPVEVAPVVIAPPRMQRTARAA